MITVKVKPDDAPEYEVTATARDVLVWEKTTNGSKSFIDFMSAPNLVDLYRIAHIAAWRQGLFAGTLKEFEQSCEVIFDEDEQEGEPDPTRPGPSPES
jgi:hypothetical protein